MSPHRSEINPEWSVFVDVQKPKSFSRLPQKLKSPAGEIVKPLIVKAQDGVIDIGCIAGWVAEESTAVLFNEWICEKSRVLVLGAAADWWMAIYLNGKPVYTTMATGNGDRDFKTSRHVFELRLRKGRNLLTAVVDSGMEGWYFVIGEPSAAPHPPLPLSAGTRRLPPPPDLVSYRREWAALRPELDAAIESCRKADCRLELVDRQGRPIPGAKLEIRQTTQAFTFGCNVLPLGQLGAGRNERYEEAFAKLFNLATTALVWRDIEPERGKFRFTEDAPEIWRRPPLDRVLKFCKQRGLRMKGQPLLTDHWTPQWVPNDRRIWREHWREFVAKVAERYGREFMVIDVANELLDSAGRIKENNLIVPADETIAWAFKTAAECFPADVILELNEMTYVNADRCDDYCALIRQALARGAGIGAIGCQFHLFPFRRHIQGRYCSPRELLQNYGKLAAFGKALFITEITIPASLGEELQAESIENLYRLWFGVPEIAGAIYWNLNDGAAWGNEGMFKGGLLDEDLREKPAYQRLYQLIQREWKTSLNLETGADGRIAFRGFRGAYRVTASIAGKSATFDLQIATEPSNPQRLLFE